MLLSSINFNDISRINHLPFKHFGISYCENVGSHNWFLNDWNCEEIDMLIVTLQLASKVIGYKKFSSEI